MDQTEAYKEGYRNGMLDADLGRVNQYSYYGKASLGTYAGEYFAGYKRAIGCAQLRAYVATIARLRAA